MTLSAFYKTGTIAVTNGSANIVLTGGGFITAAIRAGDELILSATGLAFEIASVTDETNLALDVNYPGATASGLAYRIRRTNAGAVVTERTREVIEKLNVVDAYGRGLFNRFSPLTTDADPGAGYLRLNNADASLATALYIDNLDLKGNTQSSFIDDWANGTIIDIRSVANSSVWAKYTLTTAPTDGTGYRKTIMTYDGGAGSFVADEDVTVRYALSGPAGTGDVVGPASAVDKNIATFDLTTGKFIQDSGILASSTYPLATSTASTTDWNTITTPGWREILEYGGSGGGANSPPVLNTYWHVNVIKYGAGVTQMAYPYGVSLFNNPHLPIYMRGYNGTTWRPWKPIAAPLVGAVSQVGGIPTGAIIETGSNANGSYTKFADGTMICWFDFTTSASAFSTATLPATFINATYGVSAISSISTTATQITTKAASRAATSISLAAFSTAASYITANISVVLIGRWF